MKTALYARASMLDIHLSPMALRWMVGCFLGFLLWLGFHANLPRVEFNLARPGRRKPTQSPQRGRAVLLFRTTTPHLHNRQYRSRA
jgi:hypothetical protein